MAAGTHAPTLGGPARRARPWYLRFEVILVAVLVIYPFFPFLDLAIGAAFGEQLRLDRQLVNIFIFGILALALNLQVGYAGLLQLGIAAFFAIGAFTTGVVSVEKYPFQFGFWGAIIFAPLVAGSAGFCLGAPTVRPTVRRPWFSRTRPSRSPSAATRRRCSSAVNASPS